MFLFIIAVFFSRNNLPHPLNKIPVLPYLDKQLPQFLQLARLYQLTVKTFTAPLKWRLVITSSLIYLFLYFPPSIKLHKRYRSHVPTVSIIPYSPVLVALLFWNRIVAPTNFIESLVSIISLWCARIITTLCRSFCSRKPLLT